MCYAFEQEYWLRRGEEIRREMQKNEERLKRAEKAAPPGKPAKDVEQPEPVSV